MADLLVSHAMDYFETTFDRILHDLTLKERAETVRASLILRDEEWQRFRLSLSEGTCKPAHLFTEPA